MKHLLVIAIALCTLVTNAEAQRRRNPNPRPAPAPASYEEMFQQFYIPQPYFSANGDVSCACNELERRVNGLRIVLNAYNSNGISEAQFPALRQVSGAIQDGERTIRGATPKAYLSQQEMCGRGSMSVDSAWQKWQPQLGSRGLDQDYYTGARVARSGAPVNGDPECPSGYFTERRDGMYWGLAANVGICALEQGFGEIKFWHNKRAQEDGMPEEQKKKCYYTYESK